MMSSRTKIGSLFSDVTFYVNEAPVLCFLPLDRIGEKTKELHACAPCRAAERGGQEGRFAQGLRGLTIEDF